MFRLRRLEMSSAYHGIFISPARSKVIVRKLYGTIKNILARPRKRPFKSGKKPTHFTEPQGP